MTDSERIIALEARIAQLEARVCQIEASRQTYGPIGVPPQVPVVYPPAYPWLQPAIKYDVTC